MSMSSRERIRNCIQNKPIDRSPFLFSYLLMWDETVARWEKERGKPIARVYRRPIEFDALFGLDAGFVSVSVNSHIKCGYYPTFEYTELERNGDKVIYRGIDGAVSEKIEGVSGIPRTISSLVTCREDWEKLKAERLNPDDPGRFPEDWADTARALNSGDETVFIGRDPYGLFGTLRSMMGVENLLIKFYDDPELIRDMMDYLTDFWIKIYAKACTVLKPDILHIWEDMSGKNGPLISPAMIREFMVPNYKKFRAFADSAGCAGVMVDTDGNCDKLIPPFMEGGVNCIMPFEVAAGSDVNAIRKQYPDLCLMGGIDKRKLFNNREEIDRELARIEPLLGHSGYIPMLDHNVSPEVSWDNFCYYMFRLKELVMKNGL